MLNYPASQYIAASHRDDLLREAQQGRLAREATASTTSPTHRLLDGIGRQMAALVRTESSRNAAAATSHATPA